MSGMKNFKDKVVVITGAGSGIGRATALAFAKEGAVLVIADIHADRLEEVSGEIEKLGAKVSSRRVDVSDRSQVEDLARFVIENCGRADILHNNAGVGLGELLETTSIEDFEWVMNTNFWGVVYGVTYFLPHMIERKQGHIINTASGAGLVALPGLGGYTASKFAVVGYSETLRAELKRHGIGVSAVCPGIINTRVVSDGRVNMPEGARVSKEKAVEFYATRGWSPHRVAGAIIRGVKKNRGVIPVGPEVWISWYLKRFSQRLSDAALGLGASRLF